ncbi:hypothetical protein Y88_3749 [Novosphingobium nitrogenifigens DSM 19370]|uniref:PilZ domain-containing protein n=1 Tax=Novosphingobium nitrogenifigens DSM 19370 TaxID=983920 RepID=F1ZDB9_9SPHN|nr:PilZ domain-containing protein [Novosphingobium nitrogenifigens]EGD57439.1 hypothetical protein Y88_3749 [Novosphingobium nitrogenifigens DSM 19370]
MDHPPAPNTIPVSDTFPAPDTFRRRAPRVGFELPVRCKHGLVRSTVMLKDMTRFGARIEGVELPRLGEPITLLLPGQAARMAFVVWARGRTSGLEFGDPLHQQVFDDLIRDYAIGTAMSSTASSAASSGRGAPLAHPAPMQIRSAA